MRKKKREQFAQLDQDLAALEKRLGIRSGYRDLAPNGLNNAHLASLATYYDCVPGFERLLKANDDDLAKFYLAVKALTKNTRAERHEMLCRGETRALGASEESGSP
jgi:predicted aminopeptidase